MAAAGRVSAFSNLRTGNTTEAHELTHAISFGVVHHQPRWLAGGMAEFFETVAPVALHLYHCADGLRERTRIGPRLPGLLCL